MIYLVKKAKAILKENIVLGCRRNTVFLSSYVHHNKAVSEHRLEEVKAEGAMCIMEEDYRIQKATSVFSGLYRYGALPLSLLSFNPMINFI